jgi:hypothetical protein
MIKNADTISAFINGLMSLVSDAPERCGGGWGSSTSAHHPPGLGEFAKVRQISRRQVGFLAY